MKIKKVVDLIKKRGVLIIYEDADGAQLLSDGSAVYPVVDMPSLDAVLFCSMYDITDKQTNKMVIQDCIPLPEHVDFRDVVENEKPVKNCFINIEASNRILIPYETSQGIAFIDKKYLAPFSDMDEQMLVVYERYTAAGQLYFAVKNGFMLVGIIYPYKLIDKHFVEDINSLAKGCTLALQNVKEEEV